MFSNAKKTNAAVQREIYWLYAWKTATSAAFLINMRYSADDVKKICVRSYYIRKLLHSRVTSAYLEMEIER